MRTAKGRRGGTTCGRRRSCARYWTQRNMHLPNVCLVYDMLPAWKDAWCYDWRQLRKMLRHSLALTRREHASNGSGYERNFLPRASVESGRSGMKRSWRPGMDTSSPVWPMRVTICRSLALLTWHSGRQMRCSGSYGRSGGCSTAVRSTESWDPPATSRTTRRWSGLSFGWRRCVANRS